MKKAILLLSCLALFSQSFANDALKQLGVNNNEIEYLTLSDGKYTEFHGYKDIEIVGSAIIDMKTKKIIGFVDPKKKSDGDKYELDMTTRFLTVDPMAEKYNEISPYAYVANNPIIFLDPTGMVIEEGSQKEWKKQKGYVKKQVTKLETTVNNLKAKAKTKGWSNEKLTSKIGNKTERISSLNSTIKTMGTLETSSQVYTLSSAASDENGKVTFNTETNAIDICFDGTANFVHEVTHAGQFETGDIAFNSKTGAGIGLDVFDEISAYKAQFAYDPSSVSELESTSVADSFEGITVSWVQGLGGGNVYVPGGRANTGISPININSAKADLIRAYPSNSILKSLPSNFRLKNSPDLYYKK